MQGARDLLASERGVFCILVVVACTILVLFGHVTGDKWIELIKWVAISLVITKTVTGAMESRAAAIPGQG